MREKLRNLELEVAIATLELGRNMRLIPSAGFVYLASPYSHPDPFVREGRYLRTMQALARALNQGVWMYSPIVHCHELAKVADLPRDAEYWKRYNFCMLAAAEAIWVLMLPGWEKSKGIADELEEAKRIGVTIMQIEPEETSHEKI